MASSESGLPGWDKGALQDDSLIVCAMGSLPDLRWFGEEFVHWGLCTIEVIKNHNEKHPATTSSVHAFKALCQE